MSKCANGHDLPGASYVMQPDDWAIVNAKVIDHERYADAHGQKVDIIDPKRALDPLATKAEGLAAEYVVCQMLDIPWEPSPWKEPDIMGSLEVKTTDRPSGHAILKDNDQEMECDYALCTHEGDKYTYLGWWTYEAAMEGCRKGDPHYADQRSDTHVWACQSNIDNQTCYRCWKEGVAVNPYLDPPEADEGEPTFDGPDEDIIPLEDAPPVARINWTCTAVEASSLKRKGAEAHMMPSGSQPDQPTTDTSGLFMSGPCTECGSRTIWKKVTL